MSEVLSTTVTAAFCAYIEGTGARRSVVPMP